MAETDTGDSLFERGSITSLVLTALFGGMAGRVLRYGLTFLIATAFGATALGVFSFGMVLIQTASVVASVGLGSAVQKYVSIYESTDQPGLLKGVTTFSLLTPLVVGTVIAGTLYVFWDTVLEFTRFGPGVPQQWFLLGIPLYAVMTTAASGTKAFKQTKYDVYIRDVGHSTVAVALVAIAAALGLGVRALALAYVLSLAVGCVLAVYFLTKLGAFARSVATETDLRTWLTFALPLIVAAVSTHLLWWSDTLMLPLFEPADQIGIYQVAFQTAVIFSFLLGSVNALFPSLAADLYANEKYAQLERVYTVITKWVTYVAVILYLFIAVYARDVLALFGDVYTAGVTALLVLGLSQVLVAATGPVGYLLTMSERERVVSINNVTAAALNVVLNFVLIQRYGILGAAIATGISLTLMNVAQLLEVRYFLGINPYSRRYWKGLVAILAGAVPIGLGTVVPMGGVVRLVGVGVCTAVVFAGVLWVLGFDDQDELLFESL
ncbi:MAG: flippase [Halapricum sp.]